MKRIVCMLLICFTLGIARAEQNPVLVIANAGDRYDTRLLYLMQDFALLHPEVRIELREISDYDEVFRQLEAGELDIVGFYRRQYLEAAARGLLAPLDREAEPASLLADGTYLDFRPYLEYEGKLYGMPRQWLRSRFYLNEELAQECGFTLPNAPYGWEELLYAAQEADFSQAAGVYLVCDNPACPYLLHQFFSRQYHETGTVCFEDEELRRELAAYKELYRMGLIGERLKEPVSRQILRIRGSVHGRYIFPPYDGEVVSFYTISLAQNSKNRALAEEFFCLYAGVENQSRVRLGAEGEMVLSDPSVYNVFNSSDYDEEMRIWAFDTMIEGENPGDFIMQCIDSGVMRAYLNDQISQDTLIIRLQEIMDAQLEK